MYQYSQLKVQVICVNAGSAGTNTYPIPWLHAASFSTR
uniref:Uncharacterized protein n=1 Tax=Klebsiella pneumoniae TaxID=573 RepID=A0A5P1PLD0_KLEPN|nr:hypothetical protein [Klebsiella pneumoniae]QGW58510.1 hypothetical protein pKpnB199_00003 [Klebsiella pneumoniae]QVQ58505.1 hypothetical protein [Klebsiella pneumoniae]